MSSRAWALRRRSLVNSRELRGSRPMKMFCATVRSGIRLNSWWMMLMPSSSACLGDVGS